MTCASMCRRRANVSSWSVSLEPSAAASCASLSRARDPRRPRRGSSSSQVAGDHEQQIVEVVGDAAGQLADGLHLLGLRQPALALPQRLLDMLAVADVVDHAGEIAPASASNSLTDRCSGKGRAVLAPAAHLSADADDLFDAGADDSWRCSRRAPPR